MAAKKPEVSFDIRRQAVRDTLSQGRSPGQYTYVRELFPSSVVYELSDSATGTTSLLRAPYEFNDADLSVSLGDPERVRVVTQYETVQGAAFSIDDADFGDETDAEGLFCKPCKLFDIGDYPDKNFSLTESQADEAVSEFEPAPVFLEHDQSNVLTSEEPFKLGRLKRVWRQGKELFGEIGVSQATKDLLKGKAPKLSLGWLRSPKRIREVSFVLNPRIKDAAVLTPFDDARNGDAMNKLIAFLKEKFPGKSEDEILATMSAETEASESKKPTVTAPPVQQATDQSAQFAEMSMALAGNAARSFFDKAKAEGKATPSEEASLIKAFTQALADDGGGTVKFAAGQAVEGPRCAALREMIAARPAIDLTKPQTHVFARGADNDQKAEDVLPFSIDAKTGGKVKQKEAVA